VTIILYLLLTVLSNRMASTSLQHEAPFAFAVQTVLCAAFSITEAAGQAYHQQLPKIAHHFLLVFL